MWTNSFQIICSASGKNLTDDQGYGFNYQIVSHEQHRRFALRLGCSTRKHQVAVADEIFFC